jgi:hypothetical protein
VVTNDDGVCEWLFSFIVQSNDGMIILPNKVCPLTAHSCPHPLKGGYDKYPIAIKKSCFNTI